MDCERCGLPLGEIVVMNGFGEVVCRDVEPCHCPRLCCPFCWRPIDARGCCSSIDCFMLGQIVPLPEPEPFASQLAAVMRAALDDCPAYMAGLPLTAGQREQIETAL